MLRQGPNRRGGVRRHAHRLVAIPEPLEERRTPAAITVNAAADGAPTPDSQLTLREAILVANGTLAVSSLSPAEQAQVSGPVGTGFSDPDQILFAIPGAGVQTITLATDLPAVNDAVLIDGYTQDPANARPNTLATGSNAVIRVAIDAGAATYGLVLGGGGSLVRGLSIGGADYGILIRSNSNAIQGCFIGVGPDGATSVENLLVQVWVASGDANLVGGTTPATRNVIAGGFSNGLAGMITVGDKFDALPAATNTLIQGNLVGTNAQGTAAVGSGGGKGIVIQEGYNIQIGGDDAADGAADGVIAAGNVISGASTYGIDVEGLAEDDDFAGLMIQGNLIGTNAAGDAALPNFTGISFINNVKLIDRVLIGGTTPGAGNVISGNQDDGLLLGPGVITIQGNYIGTDRTGNVAIPNGGNGVDVQIGGTGRPNLDILIGGNTPGARNVISGNNLNGVRLSGITSGSIVIQGNYIGTDSSGAAPMGNGGNGVNVFNRPARIGGTGAGEGNVIAFNGAAGVGVGSGLEVPEPPYAPILGNSIFDNGGLGIDLGGGQGGSGGSSGNGVTPNDPDDSDVGPNGYQNFPLINSVTDLGGGVFRVVGTLKSLPDVGYRIELYASDAADPTGHGEGKTFLAGFDFIPDPSGFIFFVQDVSAPGGYFTATATTLEDGGIPVRTSEFGPSFAATPPTPIDVSVAASASPAAVAPGGQVTYSFVVTIPAGPSGPINAAFSVPLPAGTTFVSAAAPSGWAVTALPAGGTGAFSASFATPAAGSTLTFILVVRADLAATAGAVLPAQGQFTSQTPDPNAANDSAAAQAVVADAPPAPVVPSVTIQPSASVLEGGFGVRQVGFHLVDVAVTLSSAPTSDLTVSFQLADGTATAESDYTLNYPFYDGSTSLVFTPGGPLTRVIRVGIIGDLDVEPDETFQVRLLAGEGYTLGAPSTSTVTIVNDDAAPAPGEPGPGPTDGVAPVVVSVARFGIHNQPTTLAVTFSEPVAATGPAAFRIVDPGRDRRFGTRDDRTFVAAASTLDAAGTTVALGLPRRLDLHRYYLLEIDASQVADQSGNALSGPSSHRIDRSSLAVARRGPARPRALHVPPVARAALLHASWAARRAERGPLR